MVKRGGDKGQKGRGQTSLLAMKLVTVSLVLVYSLLTAVLISSWEFIRVSELQVSDSYYHLALAKALWSEGQNPYSLATQLKVVESIFGISVPGCMPVGVTPVLFVLWWGVIVGTNSLHTANVIWISASVGMFLGIVFPKLFSFIRRREFVTVASMMAFLLSDTTVRAIVLGQTTLFATVVLLLLLQDKNSSEQGLESGWRNGGWQRGFLLALAAVKPQYYVVGALWVASKREGRSLAWSGVFCALAAVAMTLKLGFSWPQTYFAALFQYSGGALIPEYQTAIQPGTMNLLRFAFPRAFPAVLSSVLCSTLLLGALFWCWQRRAKLSCMAGVGAFLLFSPYFGQYEDLLLLVPVVVLGSHSALLVALPLVLNYSLIRPVLGPEVMWFVKAGVLLLLAYRAALQEPASQASEKLRYRASRRSG